jgi:GNAT superfamily N-acetyltransferase
MVIDRTIVIAPANSPEDFAIAAVLFKAYQQELGVDLCFQGFQQELENLPAMYGEPKGCLLLAKSGNEILGCVALRPKQEGQCEMKRLYVTPAARGTGAGRLLATAIIDAAKRLGYAAMVLDTLETLRPALQLYATLGFEPCAPYYHNPLPGVEYLRLPLQQPTVI